MTDFSELAEKRYSCRKFSDKQVEDEKIEKILDTARVAPTAVNGQPYFIYVVKSKEMREKLKECSPCTFDAPVIFVICGDVVNCWRDGFSGKPRAEMDVSIVTTHMMLEAEDLGLGSTWVCRINPYKLHEMLEMPDSFYPFCILPVGYPADDAMPSERHSLRRNKSEFTKII